MVIVSILKMDLTVLETVLLVLIVMEYVVDQVLKIVLVNVMEMQ